jgi:hypothetical protein
MNEQDGQLVLDYLRAYPDRFVSPIEVCRKAGGRHRFFEEPRWAVPVLIQLRDRGLVEMNEAGYYRIVTRP